MIKLFYQDKVIIFDTKNNDYIEKDVIIENKPTIELLLPKLDQSRQLVIIAENEDSAFDHFSRPMKPVIACGGVVVNHQNELLMIHRNGRWDFPKGKLEEGESLSECAVREVMEETGIDGIATCGLPHTTKHIYNIYGSWEIKTTYWYSMNYDTNRDSRESKDLSPQLIEGITACEWLSPTKAQILIHSSYSTIKEVFNILIKKS